MRDREERIIGMESLWRQFDRLVVFDTETTGIDFGRDEIIEIGAAAYTAAGEAESMDLLIRLTPGRSLPPFITDLTGITPEQLDREGVEKADACAAFCALLGTEERTLLAAYNAQFDLNFLYHFLRPFGRADVLRPPRFLDVLTVYRDRRDYPHKLCDAIAAYGLEDRAVNSHRAVDDARCCSRPWRRSGTTWTGTSTSSATPPSTASPAGESPPSPTGRSPISGGAPCMK